MGSEAGITGTYITLITSVAAIFLSLLASIVMYLLKKYLDGLSAKITELQNEVATVRANATNSVHNAEVAIANLRTDINERFLPKDQYSREYVTLSGKMDSTNRRIDRLLEDLRDSPTGRHNLDEIRRGGGSRHSDSD